METATKTTNGKSPVSKKKTLIGQIFSTKMEKTAVVLVKRRATNPKYKKQHWVSKKYKAHNPENHYKEGQMVTIKESRPLSKDKHWVILGRVGEPKK